MLQCLQLCYKIQLYARQLKLRLYMCVPTVCIYPCVLEVAIAYVYRSVSKPLGMDDEAWIGHERRTRCLSCLPRQVASGHNGDVP